MTGKNPRQKSADTQGVCRHHHVSLKLLHGVL